MKIEIEKKDLLDLIGKTLNIVEKRNTMQVLVNILLEAEDDKLKVYATDLEVSITDEVPIKISKPGKVAIGAKSLFDIAKELAEGTIKLVKKENNWLEITQGKYTSKIVGVSAEDYPVFPTNKSDNFIKLNANLFKEMIDKTIFSTSSDSTRYHLNGVFFEITNKNNLKMVATDGHRLCIVNKFNESSSSAVDNGVIIPRKGLNEIKKLLEGAGDQIEIAIEGSQFVLKHHNTVLMIRLIEGKYPNYQQFIPQKITQKAMIKREAFLTSLKRVSLLANQKSKAVVFNLTKDKLEIASNNPELGDAKEELDINYNGTNMKIGFNAKFIADILSSMNEEEVDLELNDNLSPGLVRPHNDKNYTCVVMPMRI